MQRPEDAYGSVWTSRCGDHLSSPGRVGVHINSLDNI